MTSPHKESNINLIDLCPTIQKNVNWQQVADSGFRGAIIKASQYSGTRIYAFEEYCKAAKRAGLVVGAYHFAYVGADPVKQAQFFFQCAMATGSQPGELPPVLDLEFAQPSVPGQAIVEWGEAFTAEVERLFYPDNRLLSPDDYRYRRCTVYIYPAFAQRLMPFLGNSTLVSRPLHIASYRSVKEPWKPSPGDKPLIPVGTWSDWTIWQYSGNNGYKVPGIAMDCDRNVFNGDYSAWDRFIGNEPKKHLPTSGPAEVM